jgi:hypothetical protein
MKKYIIPIFIFLIMLISLNVLARPEIDALEAERSACGYACEPLWNCGGDNCIKLVSDCQQACNAVYKAAVAALPPETEEPGSVPSSSPVTSTPADTRDYDAEEAQRQADHEARMAEIQESIDRSKAESALLRQETAAIKDVGERLDKGEVEEEDIPCSKLSDSRVREMIAKTKEDYSSTGDDYVRNSALTSDKKLIVTKMIDGELKCHGYKEITSAERQRRQAEKDAIKAKNDAIKAENALIGLEDDAYNDMQKRIENKEMVRKEVSCNSLTDPRVVEKISKTKSDHAADGQDVARLALTSDKKLYFVQIVDDELYCYGYRGAGVMDVIPQNREVHGTIKVNKGIVRILRDGLITQETDGYEVRAGDTIKTDKEGIIGVVSKDGLVQLHGDTVVGFIGLEFDPVAERRVINPPPDAPWVADPSSFKYPEVDDMAFWNALYDDLADFHTENRPSFIISCGKALIGDALALASCGMDSAAFVYGGTAWFQKKIEKDKAAGIVLTPTAAIHSVGTKFTVEVADDGTTTITTLEGSVIVTDLTTRNSVEVGTEEQVIVSKAAPLVKEEPKQNLKNVDAESIDIWWSEELSKESADAEYPIIPVFVVFLVIVAVLWMIVRGLKKKGKGASWGKWSLILGIFGLLFSIFPVVGLAPSVGAIYFSAQQKKIKNNKKATVGKVLGIIATLISVISLYVLIQDIIETVPNWANLLLIAFIAGSFTVLLLPIFIKQKYCPKCKSPLPKIRIPKSFKQAIQATVTCPKCGSEAKLNQLKLFNKKKSKKKK